MNVACVNANTVADAMASLSAPRTFRPTLGIVFASVAVDLAELAAGTRALDFPVIGCSSCGEILSCGDTDLATDGNIVGLVLDIDPTAPGWRRRPAAPSSRPSGCRRTRPSWPPS